MEYEEPCNFCLWWYRPIEVQPGVTELQKFNDYTIDLRLKEFRRVKLGYDEVYKNTTKIEYTDFDSQKGQSLLFQMHEFATKMANS